MLHRAGLQQPESLPLHTEEIGREAWVQPEALAARGERGRAAVGEWPCAALAAMPEGSHGRKVGGVRGEAQGGIERCFQSLGLRKGQCYHQPCFGCREFPANFREWPGGSIPALKVTQDLGFMLHSLDYSDSANIRSQFFRAKLVDGVMECRDVEVFT